MELSAHTNYLSLLLTTEDSNMQNCSYNHIGLFLSTKDSSTSNPFHTNPFEFAENLLYKAKFDIKLFFTIILNEKIECTIKIRVECLESKMQIELTQKQVSW